MATIKVPYTYRVYFFSPKATKYSKRLAKGKMSAGVFVGIPSALLLLVLSVNLLSSLGLDSNFFIFLMFAVTIGGGIFCGIQAEKLRTKIFKAKIRQALEEDLKQFEQTQPELVRAVRRHIETELM